MSESKHGSDGGKARALLQKEEENNELMSIIKIQTYVYVVINQY